MRAILVVTDSRRGGTPTRLATLAEALQSRGAEVLFASVMPAGDVAADLAARGIATVDLDVRRLADVPRAIRNLRGEIRSSQPDVVQTALFHANIIGRFAAAGLGVPVVSGYQSTDDDMPWLRRVADRWTARLAHRHVAVSEAVARRVMERTGSRRDRIDVVPIGKPRPVLEGRSAARAMLGIPADALVVGFVGRLHPVKDLPTLVAAHDQLSDDSWLLVIGDGEDRPLFDGRPRTVTTGMIADPTRLLSAVDVLALPSRWEGMPGALVEAMAAGVPVVASSVGGVTEIVTDGLDGLLVPPGDPESLASAIKAAARCPELGRAAAATAANRFSVERMVDGYLASWRKAGADV